MRFGYRVVGWAVLLLCVVGLGMADEIHYAKIVTQFPAQPTAVPVTGIVLTNSLPVAGSFIYQALPGFTLQPFPVTEGATQVVLPAQTIYFVPFFPMPGGGGMIPAAPVPSSGQMIEVTLPGRTLTLPSPVPQGSVTMTVPVSPPLLLNATLPPLTAVPAMHTVHGPIVLVPGGPVTLPLFPISALTLDISGHETEYHHGRLTYSLTFDSPQDHPRAWAWNVAGSWAVQISDYENQPSTATLTHTRYYNNVGGVLQTATEPPILDLGKLNVSSTETSGDPVYKIQFKKSEKAEKHLLTFSNNMGIGPATSSQPFPNVAMLALGQWLRKMGDPSLKVSAPITGSTNSISWSIPVGAGSEMNIEWRME